MSETGKLKSRKSSTWYQNSGNPEPAQPVGKMATLTKKLKRSWQSYVKKLTEANRKSFGDGPPDCCGVNQDRKTKPPKARTQNG
jgi:hypothetical protein